MYKKRSTRKSYRPRRTYKRTNVQALVKKTVKKEFAKNVETKFLITEFSGAIGNTVNFNRIATPGVGTAENQRIGDTIMVKSIYIDYSFIYQDNTNLARFIVFQWFQDSSLNPPVAASILEAASTKPVQAPYSMNNSQNYRILYDKTHALAESGGNAVVLRKHYITKIPCRKLVFTNSNADAENIKKGQIYCLEVTDSAVSGPTVSAVVKLNYTDA